MPLSRKRQPSQTGLGLLMPLFLLIALSWLIWPLRAAAAPNAPTINSIEGKTVIGGQTLYLNQTTAITLVGNAESNKTIRVYDGATLLATTTSSAAGAYTLDVALAAGSHSLTATATDISGDSSPSPIASLLIDITPPSASANIQQTGWRTNQLYMVGHNLIYGDLGDSGGSGLDFANTSISVRNNTTAQMISGSMGNNGTNRIDFYPANLADTQVHGHSYTITVNTRDRAGNTYSITRNYFYDAVSPAAPLITKIYDPAHVPDPGIDPGNTPDGSGYVNYVANMKVYTNPTRIRGQVSPINAYNAGFETYGVWEQSTYCDYCVSCTVDNGCIDGAGNFTLTRGAGQTFPQGLTTLSIAASDSAILTGWAYPVLNFITGTPQPPHSLSPWNGGEFNVIGSRLIPTISGKATPMSTAQTVQVYNSTWWTASWPGGSWYSQSVVVLPAGQTYTAVAGVYNPGDVFLDANQNFIRDNGETFFDTASGGVSDGTSFSLPNINNWMFFQNSLNYLVARSGNSLGASGNTGIGRFHHNDTYPPTLQDLVLSPVNSQTFLLPANRPTSLTVKAITWGYDWWIPGYGLNTTVSKVEVLNNAGTLVSGAATNWVYTGSLKYDGSLDLSAASFPQGRYTVRVTLEDNLTNRSVDSSRTFSIDSTAPSATNVLPGNGTVSSIPSFNADIVDPNLPDGTPGSGASLNLTQNQIDPYKRLGTANASAGSSLSVPIDSAIGGQAVDHRGNFLPIGTGVQIWDNTNNSIVGIITVGNSTASNANISANVGGTLSVNLTAGSLIAGRSYTIYYQIPHFDSNDGIRKVAAVPTQSATAPGFYASRITGLDFAGNIGTTVSTTSIQMDPPVGTIGLTPAANDVYILSPAPNERTTVTSNVIQGSSGTIVPDGSLVTVSLSGPGTLVEPDANGIAADGHQIATAANGAGAGRIRFTVRANNTTSFGPVTVNISVGAATGLTTVTMRRPLVSITKTADKTSIRPGEEITYTLAYSNTGNSPAQNVTLTDRLSAEVSFVSGSALLQGTPLSDALVFNSSPAPSGRISYNLGTVAAGANGTFVFKVRVR